MVEIVVGQARPGSGAPTTTPWFCVPAIAVLVSPLFARRRFPFAAPAAFWLLAVAVSLVDWGVTTFPISLFVVGMAAAFLLGNLRNELQVGIGLCVAIAGSATVVYLIPGHSVAQMIFIPLQYAVSWLAGFAIRESSEQAADAERRASTAERERDAAARIAVAEERARIARELHDIVAHAVSVMVLQVGAVRHKLPDDLAEDREALKRVEQAGRTALGEMRHLLMAMRREGDEVELVPQPGLESLDAAAGEGRPRWAAGAAARRGRPVPRSASNRPLGLPDRAGRADERAQARPGDSMPTSRSATSRRSCASRCATTASVPRAPTVTATASSACANESRSTAARWPRGRRTAADSSSARGSRSPGTGDDDPRPGRRRPVDGACGLPDAARARTGRGGRGRGEQRPRGGGQGGALPARRGPDGHPHAGARRSAGDAADPGHRPVGASARANDLRPRRVRLRSAPRRRQRVRAQGRPTRAAARGDSHRGRGRRAPLARR